MAESKIQVENNDEDNIILDESDTDTSVDTSVLSTSAISDDQIQVESNDEDNIVLDESDTDTTVDTSVLSTSAISNDQKVRKGYITFVSSNAQKAIEIMRTLKGSKIKIRFRCIELHEFQGDLEFICTEKCKNAAEIIKGPLVVEDTSLCFHALRGLPGPYIKWFYEKLEADGLYQLLTAYEDKSATAICVFGFTEGPGKEVILFRGETEGLIVSPRGRKGFGWDTCFVPEGSTKTYAQMTSDEKNLISHRRRALNELKRYLTTKQK